MANNLQAYDSTGKDLYAVLLSSTGQVHNGSAWEAINGANWTQYDIALTGAAAGIYLGDMPAVAAGVYSYLVYEQAGASPAVTDRLRGGGTLDWDGFAEVGNYALAAVLPSAAAGAAGGLMIVGPNRGRVLFDQVSIIANEDGEGALYIVNSAENGIGIRVIASETDGKGIYVSSANLSGDSDIVANLAGTVNGLTSAAQTDVRTAVGLATANLDTQLAALEAIKGLGWTNETLVAIDTVLAAIKAKTDLLASGAITVLSPVSVSGDATIDQGYDYYAADGRALTWTDETPPTWPDLTAATATFRVDHLDIVGSITNPTGPATITVELSRAETATLVKGVHRFVIDVALANTHLILQVRGNLVVA